MRFRYVVQSHLRRCSDATFTTYIENAAKHEIDTRASRACLKSEMQKRTT